MLNAYDGNAMHPPPSDYASTEFTLDLLISTAVLRPPFLRGAKLDPSGILVQDPTNAQVKITLSMIKLRLQQGSNANDPMVATLLSLGASGVLGHGRIAGRGRAALLRGRSREDRVREQQCRLDLRGLQQKAPGAAAALVFRAGGEHALGAAPLSAQPREPQARAGEHPLAVGELGPEARRLEPTLRDRQRSAYASHEMALPLDLFTDYLLDIEMLDASAADGSPGQLVWSSSFSTGGFRTTQDFATSFQIIRMNHRGTTTAGALQAIGTQFAGRNPER